MQILKSESKLCLICMEEHDVQTVILQDSEEFKGVEVAFDATYEYCDCADEYLETEEMIKDNSLAMKDAFREQAGLLTSREIIAIRDKYGVSQKDFSEILDWGRATITRYENHQVQDRAHDDILRKIDSDPKWFLELLARSKEKLSDKTYEKYHQAGSLEFRRKKDQYLIDSIQASYSNIEDDMITGGVALNLFKVVEIINYYAFHVNSLHKVKLMKMLWYADNLSYKRREVAITGLAYNALPMGAVPEGYEQIINLDGVEYDMVQYGYENIGYKFRPAEGFKANFLTPEDIEILDAVIAEVGHLSAGEIVHKMHEEDAYKCTDSNCFIPFTHARNLSID